jgi:hypothetical protein
MPIIGNAPSQELIDLVGALGGTWSCNAALCRCPAHDDHSPSLSIRQGDRGFLVHCYAGCDRIDVIRELSRVVPTQRYSTPIWADHPRQANVSKLWMKHRMSGARWPSVTSLIDLYPRASQTSDFTRDALMTRRH